METLAALDPADLPPIRRARSWMLVLICGAVAGVFLGVVIDANWPWAGMLAPAWIAAVALHEAGHALTGLLAGYSIVSFGVWPIIANRDGEGWKLSVRFTGCYEGFVRAYRRAGDSRWRQIALGSGGPLASLAVCLIGAAAWTPGRGFIACLSGISGLFVLAGALPARAGGPLPDLRRIALLLRNGSDARFLLAAIQILARDHDGVRPRDWPDLPGGLCPDGVRADIAAWSWLLRYNRAVDAGNLVEAESALVKALRLGHGPQLQISLRYTAAWFAAWMQRDVKTAERWFASIPQEKHAAFALSRSMASAAIVLANREYGAAASHLGSARQSSGSLGAGMRAAVEETLNQMTAEAERGRSGLAAAKDAGAIA